MKVLSFALILFYLTLFFSLFSLINNEPCIYKINKDDNDGTSTNSSTLEGINDENEKMQKCFSFSNSDIFNYKCCYHKNNTNEECAKENSFPTDMSCPEEGTVFNNCGMAGIYMPQTSATCTEISLVQGYCCYAEFSDESTACIRTKDLNKNKNTATGQMKNYLKQVNQKLSLNLEINKVVCKGYNLHHNWIFLIFAVIFLF